MKGVNTKTPKHSLVKYVSSVRAILIQVWLVATEITTEMTTI